MIFKILKVSSAALCLIPAKGSSSGDPHHDSAHPGDEQLHVTEVQQLDPRLVKNHSLPVMIEEAFVETPHLRTDEYYQIRKQKQEQERRKKERELRSFVEASKTQSNSSEYDSDSTHISESTAVAKARESGTAAEIILEPEEATEAAVVTSDAEAVVNATAEATDNSKAEAAASADAEPTEEVGEDKKVDVKRNEAPKYTEAEWANRKKYGKWSPGLATFGAIFGCLFYLVYAAAMSGEGGYWMYPKEFAVSAVVPTVCAVIVLCVALPFFFKHVVKKWEAEDSSRKKNQCLSYLTMFAYLGTAGSITNWMFFGLCDRNPANNGWDENFDYEAAANDPTVFPTYLKTKMSDEMLEEAELWDASNLDPGVITAIITFSFFATALIILLIIKGCAFKNKKYC